MLQRALEHLVSSSPAPLPPGLGLLKMLLNLCVERREALGGQLRPHPDRFSLHPVEGRRAPQRAAGSYVLVALWRGPGL